MIQWIELLGVCVGTAVAVAVGCEAIRLLVIRVFRGRPK